MNPHKPSMLVTALLWALMLSTILFVAYNKEPVVIDEHNVVEVPRYIKEEHWTDWSVCFLTAPTGETSELYDVSYLNIGNTIYLKPIDDEYIQSNDPALHDKLTELASTELEVTCANE